MEDKPIVTATGTKQMSNSPEADNSVLEIWGQHPLAGHVSISGAKNSALVVMAGVLLCSQACRLRNIPNLVDVERMAAVLTALGVKIRRESDFFGA